MIAYEQPPVFLVPTDSPEYVDAIAARYDVGSSVIDTAVLGFPGLHTVARAPVPGLGVLLYLAPVPAAEAVSA